MEINPEGSNKMTESTKCIRCGSTQTKRDGFSAKGIRIYWCKNCRSHFNATGNLAPRMRYPEEVVLTVFSLRDEGLTYPQIVEHIRKVYNLYLDHSTAPRWVKNRKKLLRKRRSPINGNGAHPGDRVGAKRNQN